MEPPDPNAFTQPLPIVPPPPPARSAGRPVTSPPRPAGSPVAYRAKFGSVPCYLCARCAALVIDIVGVAFVLTAFGFNAFDRGFQTFAGRNDAGFVTLALASLAAAFVLAFLCEALTGATLGKLTFALQTRRVDGGHAGGGRVLLRYIFLPVDFLTIGSILALATPRHQRLGDLLGGTVVSASRLRWFAPILGFGLIAAIAYAQIFYGGGLTSAIEVLAETSNVLPGYVAKASQAVGLGTVRLPAIPVPVLPSPSATPAASFATAVPAPAESASDVPPTEAPSETPGDEPSDVPQTPTTLSS